MALIKVNTPDSTLLSSCDPNTNSFTGINRVFLSTPGFYFLTQTLFETKSQWVTDITAGDIDQFDKVREVLDQSEQAIYNKSVNGQQIPVRPGRVIHEYSFDYSDSFHKILEQFDQGRYEVFLSDKNDNLYGVTDDGTTVRGFRVNVLNVKKRNLTTTQKVFSVLRVEYQDHLEFDKYSVISAVTWLEDNLVTT